MPEQTPQHHQKTKIGLGPEHVKGFSDYPAIKKAAEDPAVVNEDARNLMWFLGELNAGRISREQVTQLFEGDPESAKNLFGLVDGALRGLSEAKDAIAAFAQKESAREQQNARVEEMQMREALSVFLATKSFKGTEELFRGIHSFAQKHGVDLDLFPAGACRLLVGNETPPGNVVKEYNFEGAQYAVVTDLSTYKDKPVISVFTANDFQKGWHKCDDLYIKKTRH